MTNPHRNDMKLLQTFRFDASDEHSFELAAAPGEWAVPGAFVFAGQDPEGLTGKQKLAMRSAFLGLRSFGWSTFVVIAAIDQDTLECTIDGLAKAGVERFGAPSLDRARKAARHEIDFACSLCEHPTGTILRVEREPGQTGWHEAFRAIKPPKNMHARVFDIVADDEK